MIDKQLTNRGAKRDVGAELLQSVREMKAGKGSSRYPLNEELPRHPHPDQPFFSTGLAVNQFAG